MVTVTRVALALLLLAGAGASMAAEPEPVKFTKPPVVTKDGAKTKIEFAVSRETDVAVYIEDNASKVVRHLAAGVIGTRAQHAVPLQKGLTQSIVWDGLDDYGKKAAGGPFRVRVAAGLRPAFDSFMLGNPKSTGRIDALAVGPKGKVYVFHKNEGLVHWWSHNIKILDRDGKHVKAIWPYPADIDPKRIKALAPHQTKEGDLVPRIYQALKYSFYPEYGIMGLGRHCGTTSPAVDKNGRVYWMGFGLRLGCLDADGGAPYDTFLGPKLLTEVKGVTANGISLAVSSNGKHIYFAGLSTRKGKAVTWQSCVYRVDIKTRGPAEVFVGKPDSPGKENGLLAAPRGLAVANGLLYVGDPGADRVAVFKEADRSYVGEIKVRKPHSLGVDPATGAIYVCSYTGKRTADLIKFDGYKNGKELYRTAVPRTGMSPNPGVHRIAVDASAKPVRIWVPSTGNWGYKELTRIEDTGKAFVSKKLPRDGGGIYRDLTYDRRRDELYVRHGGWLRIDGKTDKIKARLKIKNGIGAQLVPAPDGSLVTLGSWGGGVCRHDRNGKPLNWPGQKTSKFPYHGIMNFMERVLAVRSLDEIYVILPPNYLTNRKQFAVTGGTRNTVDVLGSDGIPKRTAVWQCTHGAILRVDHKSNIYVADMVTPPGRAWPEFFDGKLSPRGKRRNEPSDHKWLKYLYGSIVKFPPEGGAIWYNNSKGKSSSCVGKPSKEFLAKPTIKVGAHATGRTKWRPGTAELQGAEWYRFGFSPYSIHFGSSTCSCEGAGFDVDMFGRVFYPNVGQFRVEVVDAANNMIGTFGKYGNQDSGGKDATVKKPEIPLAWPLTVVASDTHAYVADTINRRMVKVKLGYTTEETVDIK
jgi:DNA-binding beta-propeller fold protein YncE